MTKIFCMVILVVASTDPFADWRMALTTAHVQCPCNRPAHKPIGQRQSHQYIHTNMHTDHTQTTIHHHCLHTSHTMHHPPYHPHASPQTSPHLYRTPITWAPRTDVVYDQTHSVRHATTVPHLSHHLTIYHYEPHQPDSGQCHLSGAVLTYHREQPDISALRTGGHTGISTQQPYAHTLTHCYAHSTKLDY